MQRRSLMANKTFLFYIAVLCGFGFVVYLAIDSNSKLHIAQERAKYAKHEYETLSVQVVQLQDQKFKMEKQLQSERNELLKVKSDKDYIEQQRKELFSKLQEFTQNVKTLKAQQADLQQSLERANRELGDLRAEKDNAEQRNQAEFAQLNTQKDLEITKLRDELADLKRRYDEARANLENVQAQSVTKADTVQKVEKRANPKQQQGVKASSKLTDVNGGTENSNKQNLDDTKIENKAGRNQAATRADDDAVKKPASHQEVKTVKQNSVKSGKVGDDSKGDKAYRDAQLRVPVPVREVEDPQANQNKQILPPVPVNDRGVNHEGFQDHQQLNPLPVKNAQGKNDGDDQVGKQQDTEPAQQEPPPVGRPNANANADAAGDDADDGQDDGKPDGDQDAENEHDTNDGNNVNADPENVSDQKREDGDAARVDTADKNQRSDREVRQRDHGDRRRHRSAR